jgi:ABC-2 type transport system ATP-binding protein
VISGQKTHLGRAPKGLTEKMTSFALHERSADASNSPSGPGVVAGADQVVRVCALTKVYGRTTALRDVSLTIGAGEVFGYLGPNGAGKTTTIRLLMGLLRPTSGSATVLGHDVWSDSVEVHRRTGYVPGEPVLYDRLTGRQHVEYFSHLRGQHDTKRARLVSQRLDLDLDRPARALSKGNRQKLAIVLAVMSAPSLLILDEPTSGLDPFAQEEVLTLLREHTAEGGTVLLSSHVLAEVQRIADRVGILRAGSLIAVERLGELRAKSMHHVAARLADDVTVDEFTAISGLRDLVVADGSVACRAPQTALDALVKQLSRHRIIDLECAEAELEETFLAYYGAEVDHAANARDEDAV